MNGANGISVHAPNHVMEGRELTPEIEKMPPNMGVRSVQDLLSLKKVAWCKIVQVH